MPVAESINPTVRIHKTLSEIEQDVQAFYRDGDRNAIDTMLKIAGRALAIATRLHGGHKINEARQIVFDELLDRQK